MNESWTQQTNKGTVLVGFRKEFLKKIGPIWHLIPRVPPRQEVNATTTVFAMETSYCLHSIRSPVKGTLVAFHTEYFEKPDSIDENIWLYEILPQEQEDEMHCLQ